MADLRIYRFRVVRETQLRVKLDAEKFTPEFIAEFRSCMFDLDTVEEHASNLARLYENYDAQFLEPGAFVEGYGPPKEMGIDIEITNEVVEVESDD